MKEPRIDFDRHDVRNVRSNERRERADAGANLEHHVVVREVSCFDKHAQEIQIDQEVLPMP